MSDGSLLSSSPRPTVLRTPHQVPIILFVNQRNRIADPFVDQHNGIADLFKVCARAVDFEGSIVHMNGCDHVGRYADICGVVVKGSPDFVKEVVELLAPNVPFILLTDEGQDLHPSLRPAIATYQTGAVAEIEQVKSMIGLLTKPPEN